jgi:Na+/H+ antiporter NhaC
MGILMPIVVDATYRMLQSQTLDTDPFSPLLLASVGSVLAGAIFGDHCSPISDTTVLSSQASGCNHVAHVWTQLPYALTVAAVAVLCGTLPVGFGVPLWILMLIGPLVLAATLLLLGKRVQGV